MTKIKGFIKDVSGAFRVTKVRETNFNNASSENKYIDPINKVANELHPGEIEVIVSNVVDVSPTAKKYTFIPKNGKLPVFQAGNYVSLKLKIGNTITSRPYSISSAPYQARLDKPFFEITVRKGLEDIGFVSNYIYSFGTKVGQVKKSI